MEINEAAKKLGISVRHVRRLIKSGQLPAKKIRVQKIVEVDAWEISDEALQAFSDALAEMARLENFGVWMIETAERLGLTMEDLSKRSKVSVRALLEIAQMPGHLSGSDAEIEDRIGRALIRAEFKKRCNNESSTNREH